MRKAIALLACLALAFSAWGCAPSQGDGNNTAPAAQEGGSLSLSSTITARSLSMKYPSTWQVKEAGDADSYYIYPDCGGLVYVDANDMSVQISVDTPESSVRNFFADYFDGVEKSEGASYAIGDFTMSDSGRAMKAVADLDASVKGQDLTGRICACALGSNLYGVMAAIPRDADQKHFDVIDQMIASISVVDPGTDEKPSTQATPSTQGSTQQSAPKAQTPAAPTPKPAGNYLVGSSLPAGEYVFTATSGEGYVCAWNGTDRSDILENENFGGTYVLTVSDGMLLEVNRATFLAFDDYPHKLEGSKSEGMWKAGVDIPAGTYQLTVNPGDDHAYWCVYDSSIPDHGIVDNNNFESTDYVDVAEGQYLYLSDCSATAM